MNCCEKNNLMTLINQVSFAMDDVRLYLDTHPDCQEALEYYCQAKRIREEAIAEYTEKFGPILSYNVDAGTCWSWNLGPMPWEGDDC